MPAQIIRDCECGPRRRGEAHVERERHYPMNLLLSRLDEGTGDSAHGARRNFKRSMAVHALWR